MKISDTTGSFGTSPFTTKRANDDGSAFGDLFKEMDGSTTSKADSDDSAVPEESESTLTASETEDKKLLDELHRWANMNPAEMIRAKYLASHNMTEDSLAHLPPDQRKQIEDEIRKLVEEQVKQQTNNSSASQALSALSV